MKKLISLLLAITLFGGLMAGCSNGQRQDPTKPDESQTRQDPQGNPNAGGETRDTLYVAIESDVESLSPYEICTALSGYAYSILYERLFDYDSNGKIVPVLVESYEQTTETEWNFKLVEGILFHDGTEMKAEDVKASLDNLVNWPVPVVHEKVIEVTGDYTFKITTPQPDPLMIEDDLTKGWSVIIPKALLDSGNDFKVNPIGTGPYRFAERATAEYLKFTSFEDYRARPETDGRIPNIVFKIIPDASSRTFALENGEVDYVPTVEPLDVERLVENPDTEVLETSGNRLYNVTLNTQRPYLNDIAVREAIAYAVDPEAALIVALDGLGHVERGITLANQVGATTEGQASYDPEYAKEVLAQAGYAEGEITLDILAYNTTLIRLAESIQADLAEVGINATISTVESAVMIDRTYNGDFDMLVIGNTGIAYTVPYTLLKLVFHTNSIHGGNRAFFSNAEFDKLIEEVAVEIDAEKAEAIYTRCTEIVQKAYCVLPLFVDNTYTAYRAGMTGIYRNPGGGLQLPLIRFQ